MPSFDSPIGSKKFSGQQFKQLEVPDESQELSPIDKVNQQRAEFFNQANYQNLEEEEKRMEVDPVEFEMQIKAARAAKEAKRMGKDRLSDSAKRRIEILVGMSRVTRTVEVSGNSYSFQSLKSKEMREAIVAAAEFDGTVHGPFEMRRQFLARSLTHVAGLEFEQFIGTDSLETKLAFMDELDHSLLNRLYDEYIELTNEVKNKYSINNEVDAKEVVDDLKKS